MTAMRQRATRPLAAGLLVVLAFLLSGCMKLHGDLTVSKELTVSGTIELLIERDALQDLNGYGSGGYGRSGDPDSTVDDAIEGARHEAVPGVSVEKVSDETYVGARFTLESVDPDKVDTGTFAVQGLTVTERDDEIHLSMPNILKSGPSGPGYAGQPSYDPSRILYDEATMRFTFPGRVVEAPGGEVSGKTVVYDLKKYDGASIEVTAKKSSFPWWILFVVGGVLLLLAIGGLITALVVRKKKRQRQPMTMPAGHGGPGQAGPGGYGGPAHGAHPPGPQRPGPQQPAPHQPGAPGFGPGPGAVPPPAQQRPPHPQPGYAHPGPPPTGPGPVAPPQQGPGAPMPPQHHLGPGQPGLHGIPHPAGHRPPAPDPNDHSRFAPPGSRKRPGPPSAG